jgi:transposase
VVCAGSDKGSAVCPTCGRSSLRVHSRYTRRVAYLPWHGVVVQLELRTRRFCFLNGLCTQRIFCERLPRVVAHYARKTVRLNAALELIGFDLGGKVNN